MTTAILVNPFVFGGAEVAPITAAVLASDVDDTDAGSYTVPSVSCAANRVLVLFVGVGSAGTAVLPTVSGLGLTWSQEADVVFSANARRLTAFTAPTGSSPGSGAVTITAAGSNACAWSLVQVQASPVDPVVQAVTTSGTGVAGSVGLAAAAAPQNRPISAWFHRANEATNPRAGWTELSDDPGVSPAHGFEVQWHDTTLDSPSSASWTTSSAYGGIALELRAGVAVSGGGPQNYVEHPSFTITSSVSGTDSLGGEARAFPTAEGFGALSLGGRGSGLNDASRMTVYKVTTLNDPATRAASFDGSLRWAVESSGPRVIVFDVAGYIVLKKSLVINNPYCTIAGQTAPGDGVCLRVEDTQTSASKYLPFVVNTSHVVIRHLRSRPFLVPKYTPPSGAFSPDNISNSHAAFAIGNTAGKDIGHVILDHCSATWAWDVCLQILSGKLHDITVQWCISAEGYQDNPNDEGPHMRLLSTYANVDDADDERNITFHHNLLARGEYRVPQIATKWGSVEVYNNAGYFIAGRGININVNAHDLPGTPGKIRVAGNFYSVVANGNEAEQVAGGTGPRNLINGFIHANHDERYKVYCYDNIGPGRLLDSDPQENAIATRARAGHYTSDPECTGPPNLTDMGNSPVPANNTSGVGYPDGKFHHPPVPVTVTTARQAWRDVLQDTGSGTVTAGPVTPGTIGVGACRPTRDACDQRIVNYSITKSLGTTPNMATLLHNEIPPEGYPTLATTPANPADSGVEAWAPAGDGIPTAWKTANIPAGKFPWSFAPNGYTYQENYINEKAGDTVP